MADRDGLTLGYRIGWNIRRAVMTVFGPAQLGSHNDPLSRLQAERAAKVAEARRKR
ncbi:hypothetical protein [Agilicoccus flavus]|uniref:hypothetical protein n=1 Tax=Agilicoccus flavus TaxID=2775968 RepID=UPI001CF6DE85|nr:hypothetical protein [Agilicoccus flavus]